METYLRPGVMLLSFLLPAAPHLGTAQGGDVAPPAWSPKAAAKYLDGRGDWWLGWSGAARGQGTSCLSCHTAMPFALARPALAGLLGETEVSGVEKKLLGGLKK